MRTFNLVKHTRRNAYDVVFHTLKVVDLAYLQDYSSAASNAKTVKSAINKMQKKAYDRHAHTVRTYEFYDLIGKIKTDKEPGFTITETDENKFKNEVYKVFGIEL